MIIAACQLRLRWGFLYAVLIFIQPAYMWDWKLNLQATIDHHGPSIDSGHYTASINCCKKTYYCNDHKITEFGITDKNSSTAYIVLYKWIDTWFLDSNRRVGVWSLPWRWHILSIPLTTGRATSAETCGLDDVFPPDDLGSRPEALC